MKKILRLFASLKAKLCLSATALLCTLNTGSIAAPHVFETEAAKIVVLRPIDVWSPDKSATEATLKAHQQKKADFVIIEKGKTLPSSHPTYTGIQSRLKSAGYESSSWFPSKNLSYVESSVSVTPTEMTSIAIFQDQAYQSIAIAQGNPDELQSKAARDKYFGALLSIGTVIAGVKYQGLSRGTDLALGTGAASDIYQAVTKYESSIAPLEIGNIDFNEFKSIELRRVLLYQQPIKGQIIIAYKGDKTEAAEHEALVIAVVALTGANSTTAEIEQARKEDFARRKAIWDKCVADGGGTCKPEPIRRGGG